MQIIHHLIIDLARQQPIPPIGAVQGDANTRAVEISLQENGVAWEVPTGVTAAVAFRKPDKTKGLYDQLPDGSAAVTIAGSTVSAILAPQVLSCAGEVSAAVVFHDADLNQLATFPFVIRVKGNPAAGQEVSNDYYKYSTMEAVSGAVEEALASLETEKQAFLAKAEEALQVVHDTATEDAPAIVCEASGETVTVADAAQRPLQGLSIYGKTVQNGTPTPENPVPLESVGESGAVSVSVAGKNLFDDVAWFKKYNGVQQSDGSWMNVFASTACFTNTLGKRGSIYLTAIAKTDATTGPLYLQTYYTDGIKDNSIILNPTNGFETLTAITNPNKTVDYIKWSYGRGGDYYIKGVMISFVDNEYEPYKPIQTITVSTEGGLHGIGDIKDEIDFARGVRINRFAVVDMGALDWTYRSAEGLFSSNILAQLPVVKAKGLCTHYKVVSKPYATLGNQEMVIYDTGFSRNACAVVKSSSYTDAEAFKAAMSGVTLIYELAEPMETPLSAEELAQYSALHTGKPTATVFNDANAGMRLNYVADTKAYIDNKFAAISAAMLNA